MKRTGRHPDKALTAVQVKQLKEPGRYTDGNGLYLVVDASGAKRWLLRIVVMGRRRDIGLGGTSWVSLAEARDKAYQMRKIAREGGDPVAASAAAMPPTFQSAAETVHADHKATWKNAKHADQWLNTLKSYVFPELGRTRVDLIDTPAIVRVLSPIWLSKPETARRVKQRIGTVLDWAKASGHRSGDNPVLGVNKGLPKQSDRDVHHAALPYADVPAFVQRLRSNAGEGEPARLAFEFLILTVGRTSEILGARWDEVDLAAAVWTIPAERMKTGRGHRVPLCSRTVAILKRVRELRPKSPFVFPGRSDDTPLSNMVFLAMLKRMQVACTAHGFRSSFRDWASETNSAPREVAEMALAHAVQNKVEAAYRRGDLLEQRRNLMQTWETYLGQNK